MGKYSVIDRRTPAGTSLAPDLYPDGYVAVIDKPYGWTSADAVRKIKFGLQKHYGLRNVKVGHAGTLDPLATGVLLICVGKATKVAEALQAERKEYVADVTFGATTPSFDKEKEVDAVYPYEHITPLMIDDVLGSMQGEQMQMPPVYSAKYVDGVRAYERVRQGEEVFLMSRPCSKWRFSAARGHISERLPGIWGLLWTAERICPLLSGRLPADSAWKMHFQ